MNDKSLYFLICSPIQGNFFTSEKVKVLIFWWFFFASENTFALKDVLKFIIGSEEYPPVGLPKKMSVQFKHGCPDECRCRPTASTCSLTITLPVHANSFVMMTELMTSALTDCFGFGLLWNLPLWLSCSSISFLLMSIHKDDEGLH